MNKSLAMNMSTHLITIQEEDSIQSASALMTQKKIRHLAVVDSRGLLTGVISQTDIQNFLTSNVRVKALMSQNIRTIDSTSPLSMAIEAMLDSKISCLVVVDGLSVAGIITTEDLLKLLDSILNQNLIVDVAYNLSYRTPIGNIAHTLATLGI